MVENPPANAGDIRGSGSIPGSGRYPGEGNGKHSSILAREIPWTEKLAGYSHGVAKELDTTKATYMHVSPH